MILCALALYIDTGLRSQELLRAEWSWVNVEAKEITVPAHIAKGGRERKVPLHDCALAILAQIPKHPPKFGKTSNFRFVARKPANGAASGG